MANIALQQEFEYYKNNHGTLVKKYKDKYVVIKGREVMGGFDSLRNALNTMSDKKHKVGTFLVQRCLSDLSNTKTMMPSRLFSA